MHNEFTLSMAIEATAELVWMQLTKPALMAAWMSEPEMALTIEMDWEVGTDLTMRGKTHVPFTKSARSW